MIVAPAARASTPAADRTDAIAGSLATDSSAPATRAPLRFDRNELSGAFGDIGTDLPLIVGMIAAARLDPGSVLVMFGLMQVLTGLLYRMPMPVQPLKAVAAIVITQQVSAGTLEGGGLAIGVVMLLLALTGALDWLARVIPLAVVRGLQAGLGMQLALLALRDFIPSQGVPGYVLAAIAFVVTVMLLGNRRYPPAVFVLGLGVLYAVVLRPGALAGEIGFSLPTPRFPAWSQVVSGFLLLALPQIPLSLGNSVLATHQVAADLFPEREPPGVRRIGITYALMNFISPLFGGVPVCHGSGGMCGHYALGGRTGASVILYGGFLLLFGLFFAAGFGSLVEIFPRPVLGVLLVVEGLALLTLVRDLAGRPGELTLALLVGLAAAGLPYGYLIGMVVGVVLAPLARGDRLRLGP